MGELGEVVPAALVEALSPGATVSEATRLTGDVSATTFALTLARVDGVAERVVVRHRPASTARGGLRTAQEHALLSALHASDIPVAAPRLLWSLDTMVMEWVDGSRALPPDGPRAMADALVRIHAHRGVALDGLPPREDRMPVLTRCRCRRAHLARAHHDRPLPPAASGRRARASA